MKLVLVLVLVLAPLAATAHAERMLTLEPELGAALLDFDHDCPGAVDNGFCKAAGSYSGGMVGLGSRYAVTDEAGISIRGRFDLVDLGRSYFVGIGGYYQVLPSAYVEATAGFGSSAQVDDYRIETRGYMASLRLARQLSGWWWLAAQASTHVYRIETDSRYPMRSYEASVAFVLAVPIGEASR